MKLRTIIEAAGFAVAVLLSSTALADDPFTHFVFRAAAIPQGLEDAIAVQVFGRGRFIHFYGVLPPGSGNATTGAKIFAARCSGCHSTRGSKTPAGPMGTCWRSGRTMFNFVKRAMPFNAPGSLKNNDIYAAVAYLLSQDNIIKPKEIMNAKTLPKVAMPNRDGLIPNFCPERAFFP